MLKKVYLYTVYTVLFLLFGTQKVVSQVNVGSEVPAQDFSSVELSGSDRGLRLNRLSTQERDLLPVNGNPLAIGLMIYNTDNRAIEVWNGNKWLGAGQSVIFAKNGLFKDNDSVKLGGDLNRGTSINLNEQYLNFIGSKSVPVLSIHDSTIGIGTHSPASNAILDISASSKGVLLPRITLTGNKDQITIPNPGKGMLIYNTGESVSYNFEGYLYWNGSEWRKIDGGLTINPELSLLNCGSATLEPASFKAGEYYTGILKVPYEGGNGGQYNAGNPINSQGNTGLTATLKAGTLEHGNGFLVYEIRGTPTANSPVPAIFTLSFMGVSCNCTVGDIDIATVSNWATLGPLLPTFDNGVAGYHRVGTTPDGKYSVRVFVPIGTALANADLQIRSNKGASTIMWNGHYSWNGGSNADATNSLNLPDQGVWYGNTGNSGLAVSSNKNAAWGNADVYHLAPEQRSYMWTSTDINDKTMYILTFMMGAPSAGALASGSTAQQTKAYLEIRQIRTPD